MIYTADKLIEAIKRNASTPSSQRKYQDSDLLAFLNEELELTVVTELINQQQDYFIEREQIPLVANQSVYSFPNRAIGWKVETVGYVDSSGAYTKLSKISRSMRGDYAYYASDSGPCAFYVEGMQIHLIPEAAANVDGSLEIDFVRIRNELVKTSSTGLISAVADLGLSYQMTVNTIPSVTLGVDVISGQNPFNVIARGATATVAGQNITVDKTAFDSIPVAGDYVAAKGQTPIPNIPEDFHPILAQAATIRVLSTGNDAKGIQLAQISFQRMIDALKQRTKERVGSSPNKWVSKSFVLNRMRGRVF